MTKRPNAMSVDQSAHTSEALWSKINTVAKPACCPPPREWFLERSQRDALFIFQFGLPMIFSQASMMPAPDSNS
jgi:hypothetical protein